MKIQKQTNLLTQRALTVGEALDESAETSAAGNADLHFTDRAPTLASLLRILHGLGTAYRLSRERCRQRRQLMEIDDRELIDTDITREQAEGDTIHPLGYAAMNLILSGVAVLQLGSRQAPIAGP